MGGVYGTYEGRERCIQGFGVEICEKKKYLEDLSLDGNIIISWICRKYDEGHIIY